MSVGFCLQQIVFNLSSLKGQFIFALSGSRSRCVRSLSHRFEGDPTSSFWSLLGRVEVFWFRGFGETSGGWPVSSQRFTKGSSQTWLFQAWLFVIFTRMSSFVLSCALLRSFADLHLRSFVLVFYSYLRVLRPTVFRTTAFGNCRYKRFSIAQVRAIPSVYRVCVGPIDRKFCALLHTKDAV